MIVARPRSRFPLLAFTLLASGLVLPTTGCGLLRHLMGTNTIDLEGAEVKSVGADIRKAQKTICPRETVQMAVFLEAQLKGDKEPKPFETWEGKAGASRNDKLDFGEFAFFSELGAFDENGWFTPKPDVLATAGQEFVLKTVYKKRPDKFSLEMKYKPDYACIKAVGKEGPPGSSGSSGPAGEPGKEGSNGGTTNTGGDGSDGANGGNGGDGGDGGDGPRLTAFATMVKTPFYDKLLAIKITGDLEDLILAPPDSPVTLSASGGDGGPGGGGGPGGRGGRGGSGIVGGKGGKGGSGGSGGKGGKGGKGGEIELVFDPKFPELAQLIKLDVSGGDSGGAGPQGGPGEGGSAGTGTGQNGKMGTSGPGGSNGHSGQSGAKGPDGHAASHTGAVGDKFAGLSPLVLLGDGAASADAPKDDKGKKGDDKKDKKDKKDKDKKDKDKKDKKDKKKDGGSK
jgi:hypothetical protein